MRNENKKGNEKNHVREGAAQLAMCMSAAFGLFMSMGFYSCAAELGKKSADWFLDQVFWVGVILLIIALIGCFTKKAWIQGIIILIVGALILFLVKNPTIFETIGSEIGNLIFTEGGGEGGK